jgi:hypothetical protein
MTCRTLKALLLALLALTAATAYAQTTVGIQPFGS